MDIIFCRNVLMYFSRSQAQKVIERFRQCLVNGGWLIVSPSEASAELFSGFTGVYYPDAIFFRKNNPSNDPAPASVADPGARCEEPPTIDITAGVMYAVAAVEGFNPKRADAPDTDLSASETDAVRRARLLANEGDTAEAMRCLERVIIERPSSAELYFAKALIAMEAGDTNDALRSLKRVIYLHPDNIMAHYLMGAIHSSQDRRRDAARIFETVGGLLAALQDDDLVPGSEGLSSAYLLQSVKSYLQKESA
jgi:chemotaxis protein methyltransferase CheR